MKLSFNKYNRKIEKKSTPELDIDQILTKSMLSYSDIDFDKKEVDILRSYNKLNKRIYSKTSYFKNIKLIIPHINFKPFLKPIYTVIITLVIILSITKLNKMTDHVEYTEISVEAGEKITLHITDEIKVWLNSNSTIKIPLEFNRKSKILLDGEAYFEINKIKKNNKTQIISHGILFETTNGSFNINSRHPNHLLIANVKEGEVDIYNPNLVKSTRFTLGKGEKATYNPLAEFIAIENFYNVNFLAWKTGILKFNNANLKEVTAILTKYYDIPIRIENSDLESKTFTASFQNVAIDEVLDKIQSSLNCTISGDGQKLIIN